MRNATALSGILPPARQQDVVEARLRFILDQMADCIEVAHLTSIQSAHGYVELAVAYADLAADPWNNDFNIEAIGASLRTGPYGGLSATASLISELRHLVRAHHRTDLAEVTWHARDLLDGYSPFAEEMLHAGFQEAYARLADRLHKEGEAR